MAITDTATHALLIDGEHAATPRTPGQEAFGDVFRARRAGRELEAGTVWINEHLAIGSEMPHGGVKGSGFGKDMSMYALEECTAIEHVVLELTGETRKDSCDAVSSR
jgi:hypothetical protein